MACCWLDGATMLSTIPSSSGFSSSSSKVGSIEPEPADDRLLGLSLAFGVGGSLCGGVEGGAAIFRERLRLFFFKN